MYFECSGGSTGRDLERVSMIEVVGRLAGAGRLALHSPETGTMRGRRFSHQIHAG